MSNNTDTLEQHGCIVCGKVYNLLVVYIPGGRMLGCMVTSPGGRIVPDSRPLVACDRHTREEVNSALERHYPGRAVEDLEDDLSG